MRRRLLLTGLPLLFGMLLALSITLLATLRGITLGDLSLPAHVRWLGAACVGFMLLVLCRRVLLLWFGLLDHLEEPNAPRWTRLPSASIIVPVRQPWTVLWNRRRPALCGAVWMLAIDTIAWPLASVAAHLALLYLVTVHGPGLLLVWWMFFTLLDLAAALHAVGVERESPGLLPYATLHHILFALPLDVCKVLVASAQLTGTLRQRAATAPAAARRSLARFRSRIAPQPRCGTAHGAAGGPSPFGKG